jgi:hypothetical protein
MILFTYVLLTGNRKNPGENKLNDVTRPDNWEKVRHPNAKFFEKVNVGVEKVIMTVGV